MKLTIGMAHYDDFHGAYFTIQDIRKELIFSGNEHLLNEIEFVVVDNNPESKHGLALERFLKNNIPSTNHIRYVKLPSNPGTSVTRNRVIDVATGDFVLVMDCHVVLCPLIAVIKGLLKFIDENPDTQDLYTGPLVSDDMKGLSTHFNDGWSSGMWGQWGSAFSCGCGFTFTGMKRDKCIIYRELVSQKDITACSKCGLVLPTLDFYGWRLKLSELGYDEIGKSDNAQFEIPAQGLGVFFTKKSNWLRFNPHCRGFGGEEWYIHEKYRKAGRKTINLSFLKWLHRFVRPDGVAYPLTAENKLRNYILELTELGMPLDPALDHFSTIMGMSNAQQYIEEANSLYGVM